MEKTCNTLKRFLVTLIFLLITAMGLLAQTVEQRLLGVSSGIVPVSDFQLEWSVGELSIEVLPTAFGQLTEGFIQPEIFVDQQNSSELEFELFELTQQFTLQASPNPVSNDLYLKWSPSDAGINYLSVFDFTGKLMVKETLPAGVHYWKLDMSQLPDGLYVISYVNPQGKNESSIKVLKAGE